MVRGLPPKFVLYDSEYTSWQGAQEREWTGPHEYREIVQMGAIKVDNPSLAETDALEILVKPRYNPALSDFFINLTGITQAEVDDKGVDFPAALTKFKSWCGDLPIYSFGRDGQVVLENCALSNIPCPFSVSQFHNIREFFKQHGIPADDYLSSNIVEAFGKRPTRREHQALDDARSILDGLKEVRELLQGKTK